MSVEPSPQEMLRAIIAEHYALGEVSIPSHLEAAHQRRHQKLVVETGSGRFLVKTYKTDPYILDALRFQHRLSDHLRKHELPVAKIQPARDGKRIVELPNFALELQQFVVGEGMRVTGSTLAESAWALGKLHHVCRDFPRPQRDARMWRFSEVPRDSFRRLYELALEEGDTPAVHDNCNQIALFLHEAGKELSIDARGRFETGLIHGDWHGGNLLFKGNKLQAILDLEFAGDGCYLEDLSYAMSNLCVRTTMDAEKLLRRTEVLLTQYQRYRSLSFDEVAALHFAVGVKHVATVSYQTQQHGKVAGHTATEWLERLAFQCNWLAQQAKAVRWGH